MRILIYSPLFYPSIGGLETIVSILAHEFVRQGHDVKLVCSIRAKEPDTFPFEVYRRSNPYQLLKLTDWCDIFFQANVSLKGIWPLIIKRKPLAISHNGWYSRPSGRIGWQDRLKQQVARHAYNISVSRAVADHLSSQSAVIPNAYRDDIFFLMTEVPRNKHLVFLGRLVSDKGADLLLDALAQLKSKGLCPQLTIIGNGPEGDNLRRQAIDYKIDSQIEFAGQKTGIELTRLLNKHQVMVIPSRCNEGFGIVALEGIACGCVIVGSESGGLKDAIGPCGVVFSKGDVRALTEALFDILSDESALTAYRSRAEEHLAQHKIESVVKAYLQVFERAVESQI